MKMDMHTSCQTVLSFHLHFKNGRVAEFAFPKLILYLCKIGNCSLFCLFRTMKVK